MGIYDLICMKKVGRILFRSVYFYFLYFFQIMILVYFIFFALYTLYQSIRSPKYYCQPNDFYLFDFKTRWYTLTLLNSLLPIFIWPDSLKNMPYFPIKPGPQAGRLKTTISFKLILCMQHTVNRVLRSSHRNQMIYKLVPWKLPWKC